MTALAALALLAVLPAASADAGSPPATAQGAGKSGSGNGNAGGNGNGNGHGTSTTTSTTQVESTSTTQVESTSTTQVESTNTTQVETTTTTVPSVGAGDDGTTTTTLAPPITTGPLDSDPADGEPTTTTVVPSTSTTVTTSTTPPQPVDRDGTAGGPDGDQPIEIESRPAFFADFADRDRQTVVPSGAASPARLGALFDTWAWSDPGGGGLAGATFEMLAAVIRAIMTAGSGMAVPASLTATLLVLALWARHRETDRAIPSAS